MKQEITLRVATPEDFESLYAFGKSIPEINPNRKADFMNPDEFLSVLENKSGIVLIAFSGKEIAGFIYANQKDVERAPLTKYVCIVFLAVKKEYRRRGAAQKLYDACIAELKKRGAKYVYTWANAESDGSIVEFMEKQGFEKGHTYIWMDKEI